MNYGRLALAVVGGFIADAVFGFLIYGMLMAHQFEHFPGVYRPMATQGKYMPILFAGILIAMIAAAYIYAKGYEGGSGVGEGVRFGMCIGLFAAGYAAVVGYSLTNIDHYLGFHLAVANFAEWTINGTVIGLIYRPSARAGRAAPPAV
ncbi:MAG TPA: hypothetical protein VEU08_17700 [Vicinamibacterales bacterium]|nr:hypothetical protein [Vicinamibacterales bacterium]